jgi:hypothetical protein
MLENVGGVDGSIVGINEGLRDGVLEGCSESLVDGSFVGNTDDGLKLSECQNDGTEEGISE